jgi:hypothetical protein
MAEDVVTNATNNQKKATNTVAFLFAKSQAALGKGETKPQPRPTQGANPRMAILWGKKANRCGFSVIHFLISS